jgi:hypothetical protein
LFFGKKELAYQFANSINCNRIKIKFVGKYRLIDLVFFIFKDIDIIAINGNYFVLNKFLNSGYFLLPNIDFVLDLNRELDLILNNMSKRRKRDLKKMKRKNYEVSISRDCLEDFDFFYFRMYLPFIKKRFRKGALISSFFELKKNYENNGGIVFVKKGNEKIVGLLFKIVKNDLYAKSLGVVNGDQRYINDFAGQAALYNLVKWAIEKEFGKLNYGNTLPFFFDGIFNYKKEWGMYIKMHPKRPFIILKPDNVNIQTLSFLQENPFIFVDKKTMKGLVFLNKKPLKNELENFFSNYFLLNLKSIIFVTFYIKDKEDESFKMTNKNFVPKKTLNFSLFTICSNLEKNGYNVEIFELTKNN